MPFSEVKVFHTPNLILLTGFLTTIIVWTPLYDPINVPKMLMLSLISAWILGTISVNLFSSSLRNTSLGMWATVAFMMAIIVSAILTDDKYTAFFGATQRNDGAITYFFLAVLCLAAMTNFNRNSLHGFKTWMVRLGLILTLYGLLQLTGNDPVKWALIYGPVIGTLGNPDFMSAALSACAIATLWATLATRQNLMRMVLAVGLLAEIYVLKKTGSIQGVVAFSVGVFILLLGMLWQRNRRLGLIGLIAGALTAFPVLAGFADKGPLAEHLFRSSMKNRLDYWHAAIGMFKAHPIFGVGLDRFGENYGQYAPKIQVVQGQITNNAHNVFLQLLSTGGLLLFLPYVFLIGVIFYQAMKAITSRSSERQFDLFAVLSIWFSLLLVSIISIDNIGVTIWFWISGGVLYAISLPSKNEEELFGNKILKSRKVVSSRNSQDYIHFSRIVSLILTLLVFLMLLPLWRTSIAVAELQTNRSHLAPTQYQQKLGQVANIWPRNSQTLVYLSDLGMRIRKPELAVEFAKEAIKEDSKTNFGRQLVAIALESEQNYGQAIPYRLELLKLDRWNTANMLVLVKDYLGVNDKIRAKQMATKIAELYPNSADAETAATLLKG